MAKAIVAIIILITAAIVVTLILLNKLFDDNIKRENNYSKEINEFVETGWIDFTEHEEVFAICMLFSEMGYPVKDAEAAFSGTNIKPQRFLNFRTYISGAPSIAIFGKNGRARILLLPSDLPKKFGIASDAFKKNPIYINNHQRCARNKRLFVPVIDLSMGG